MNRRDLFKITGALAAVPAVAVAAPPAVEAAWKPSLLNAHQNETVVVLTDLIIPETDTPGARASNVIRYIDLFLKDAPDPQAQQPVSGLGWLDRHANQIHGHAFTGCSIAMLELLDANKEPGLQPGHQFFAVMNGMTSQFYYFTAIGFRELNKGGRVPSTFGCKHGGHA